MVEEKPLVLKERLSPQLIEATEECLTGCLASLVTHLELRSVIIEDFKKQVINIQLYHGEMERFKRDKPEASCEPGDVLSTLRNADFMRVQQIQKTDLSSIASHKRTTEGVAHGEKERVLLAKGAIFRWLSYKGFKQASQMVQNCFLMEEYSLEKIEEALCVVEKRGGLYFIKLVQKYYVLSGDGVFSSEFFGPSLMVWLALLTRMFPRELAGREGLHPALDRALPNFLPVF